MEPKAIVRLSERSTQSVWKEILIIAIGATGIAVALNIWMAKIDWIVHFNKSFEIHTFPFLASAVLLGVIWIIRGTLGYVRSNNVAPMNHEDYLLLREIFDEFSDFPSDRLTRWTLAILLATAGYAIQAAPGAGDSIKISIFTFWLPLVLYLSAAMYAFDVVLLCFYLAAIAALIWVISLLPVPLAILVGAGMIAYAIYRTRRAQ